MATLKLRRGSSFTSPQISEPFFNSSNNTMLVGFGTSNGEHITLVKLGANTGSVELTGDLTASNITLSGDLSARNVTLSGNIILGDEIADNINVTGQFSGSLIPSQSNEYDLGTSSKKWRNLHVVSGTIDDITLPGSNIVSSSQQISDYGVFLEFNGDNVVSGSIQIDHDQTTNFVSNEHINHSSVSIIAGDGMSGGGNILTSKTLTLNTGSDHFLEGVKKKINTEDVVSGSVQVDHDATTNFVANEHIDHTSVSITAGDGLTGGGTIASTRTINVESANNGITINADNIELVTNSSTFTDGVKAKLNTETVVSGSVQVDHDSTTNFVANEHIDHTTVSITAGNGLTGGGTIASTRTINIGAGNGITVNSDDIEVDMSVFDTGDLSEGSNLYYTDARVKTKLNAETVISGSSQLTTEFDTRYLNTDGDSVVSGSSQVPMGGDLSGNADNVTVDKVKGVSLTSGEATQLSNINSVTISNTQWGYLGSSNQGISTTDNVTFADGDFTGDVSITGNLSVLGSATEIQTSELRVEDKLITVASGSADSAAADGAGIEIDGANKSLQWDHNTSQFVFDAQVSSSVGFKGEGGLLTGIDTDQVTEAGNLYYTNTRVKAKLNSEDVISGSSQLHADLDLRYLEISGDNVFSGSEQVNADSITNFDSNVKDKMNADDVISGSSQLTTEFDTRYLNTNGDSVVSQSVQIDHDSTTGFVANEHIDHSTITIGSGKGLIGGGTITTSRSLTLATGSQHFGEGVINALTGSGIVSSSTQISNYNVFAELDGDSLISSSQQIDDLGFLKVDSDNVVSSSQQISNYNTFLEIGGDNVISSSVFTSPSQGTVRATINGTQTNVDTGLQSGDSPTFQGLTLENVSGLDTTHYTVFMSGSGGVVGKRTLATAAFYHVSSSISDGNTAVLGNAGAVKDYIDEALVAVGAGDITKVTAGAGMSGSTDSGEAVVAIDTGSQHFGEGVINALTGSGIVSSSAQIDSLGFLQVDGDSVVSQSLLNDLTNAEVNQLSNINTSTISTAQWGYVGGLNQNLATSNNVTFADGNFSGDVQISGDLVVQGAATEIQVSELRIEDKLITVASGSADSSAANGAGLEIAGANESITWDHGNSRFNISDDIYVVGTVKASDDIVAYVSSDERLKTEVKPIENPIQKINSISGNSFVWDEEKQNIYKGKDYGVIAQEIEKVLPELVNTREDGYKAVKYDRIVSLLIEGIKELSDEVNQLKEKINKE